MILPSKELLSEVLGKEIFKVSINDNKISYITKEFGIQGYRHSKVIENINIHELAYKFKEWALNKGYEIRTSSRCVVDYYSVKDDYEFCDCNNTYNNEPEAIFKACEWMLKELK